MSTMIQAEQGGEFLDRKSWVEEEILGSEKKQYPI
jgi:hypothetical protein